MDRSRKNVHQSTTLSFLRLTAVSLVLCGAFFIFYRVPSKEERELREER